MAKAKDYTNGEITVHWQPDICVHSGNCVRRLSTVFDPKSKPWIDMNKAETDQIISAIKKCPSGALSWSYNGEENKKTSPSLEPAQKTQIQILPNGPLLVKGPCVLISSDGTKKECPKPVALCRCGHSENKPFCDGKHKSAGFKG